MTGTVTYVGAGPGAVGLMTRGGRDALTACDVVVLDRRSSGPIVDAFAPTARRVLVGRAPGQKALTVAEIATTLADLHRAGDRVVRLKSGDLFVCSRAAEEVRALQALGIGVALVPGVSAALAAPLRADLALLAGDECTVTVVAGNDDPAYPGVDWPAISRSGGPVVVLMGRGHQAGIGAALRAGGRDGATPVAVVHGATKASEQIHHTVLAALERCTVPAPTTVIVGATRQREQADAHP